MAERDEPRPGEGRLERWSRRKREAVAEKKSKAELPPVPPDALVAARTPAAPAKAPEAGEAERQKKIDDATKDLPPIESLGQESDYSLFMRDGVPEETRTAALRKLWRSDPAYREPFPYEMHMEDYNKTFVPINAATDTIFRAGLGYLFDDDAKTKADADKPAGKELASPSAPGVIEAGGENKSDSAESGSPIEDEKDKSDGTRSAIREGEAEIAKPPAGKTGS